MQYIHLSGNAFREFSLCNRQQTKAKHKYCIINTKVDRSTRNMPKKKEHSRIQVHFCLKCNRIFVKVPLCDRNTIYMHVLVFFCIMEIELTINHIVKTFECIFKIQIMCQSR